MRNLAPALASALVLALAHIFASAALCGWYARGGLAWLLGFVMLVPWLRTLDARRTLAGTLLCAWAMSVAFTAAVFGWFGIAIGNYTQAGAATGLAVLLLGAPLFQPQLLAFALVRHLASRRYGKLVGAVAGAAAWVACEWLLPKLLGDTLGHGLYPSRLLRQGADVGGAAGLTLLLLLANEGVASAIAQRADGWRAMARALLPAALLPLLLALYGLAVLPSSVTVLTAPAGKMLRLGLIQSNIVDYERQRQQLGAYGVVRKVLDTHFAMSYDAVVRQHADAVMWSETSYPTTFGHPKSAAGAELDQSILDIVNAAGVPFIFGTYDRDAAGEYNAAAFVAPGSGLAGFYRKTRLFPFTEYVPAWLDGPLARRWLPWSGNWRHGNGARVFPLRLADGREVVVLPLICRDDVDPAMGIAGARLGAQAILTMSNDAWFLDYPQGAELHQAVAAFRSIETRLPQFRVTTNGYSGVIDPSGSVLSAAGMGEQTLVIGEMPMRTPPRTLMVLWGDWVGLAALAGLAFLLLLAANSFVWRRLVPAAWQTTQAAQATPVPLFPLKVAVLPPAARFAAALLRTFARASLLWMAFAMLQNEALRSNTMAQIRTFAALFLAPEAASWCVLLAFAARASVNNGVLVLAQGKRRIGVTVREIVAVQFWRWPIPGPGLTLRLASGGRWRYGLALADPAALVQALGLAQADAIAPSPVGAGLYQQARLTLRRGWLAHPLPRFVLLPLALALPAYYLHQHIAYGSGFGEYTSFGLKAYVTGLALWWAAWAIGVALCGAVVRAVIEVGTLLAVVLHPGKAIALRHWLERCGNAVLYLGLPGWLLLRIYGG